MAQYPAAAMEDPKGTAVGNSNYFTGRGTHFLKKTWESQLT